MYSSFMIKDKDPHNPVLQSKSAPYTCHTILSSMAHKNTNPKSHNAPLLPSCTRHRLVHGIIHPRTRTNVWSYPVKHADQSAGQTTINDRTIHDDIMGLSIGRSIGRSMVFYTEHSIVRRIHWPCQCTPLMAIK